MSKNFIELINTAIKDEMIADKSVICYGLGANDPLRIFGSTKNLLEEFGQDRVFDIPTSENALTGVAVGAALAGNKVIFTHQRLDFSLLTMDQLINSAAKWYFMFGGEKSIPITIRMIIGRGWGQGPTHSQALHALFAHIPGLKIVMPTFPDQAYSLLRESIQDPNPVLFLEHRWLHQLKVIDNPLNKKIHIGQCNIVQKGNDLTIIALSYMTLEAMKAVNYMQDKYDVSIEIIDLVSVAPIKWETMIKSVIKTKKLLVLDISFKTSSFAAEIITTIIQACFYDLKSPPVRMTFPDIPKPTSFGLTKNYYYFVDDICREIGKILEITDPELDSLVYRQNPHDIPGDWFKGPF